MLIVGLNAYHGDVAAAVIRDGHLVAAVEEERFARIKHVAGFPEAAIVRALAMAGATPADVNVWAIARGRRVHLLRKAWFGLTHRPGLALVRQYLRGGERFASVPQLIADRFGLLPADVDTRVQYIEHHHAHLASAFHVSGLAEAACCAIDGFGDFVSVSIAAGGRDGIDTRDRVYFPHSLGLFYQAITQYLGFKNYGDEYKVMGLAAYGEPTYADALRKLLVLKARGRFELALPYFRHWTGETTMEWDAGAPSVPDVYSEALIDLLGPARQPSEPVTSVHQQLAASVQVVFEEAMMHVLNGVHARVPMATLCLAGGCAMNSVANGKIRGATPFTSVFIQPAASDNGTALGAALAAWHATAGRAPLEPMTHSYWGTEYTSDEIGTVIRSTLATTPGAFTWETIDDEAALCGTTASAIASGQIIGWFQGRMEWGARALGNRSILGDPRRADMRDILNKKIKLREQFRPFAPSVLADALDEFFVDAVHDPFMLQVYPVRPDQRARIPAVTHVDGSARIQSISEAMNPRYTALVRAFREQTGIPMLLNTSFNENEPIVEHPQQALDCFLRTDMDMLVMGPHCLRKVR